MSTSTPSDGFWSPNAVQHYHDYLQRALPQTFVTYRRAYIRNIAYAFQYLEFLDLTLKQSQLHATVKVQMYKTFVITGCSIIESTLWILLKGNNLHKTDSWEEIQTQKTNEYVDNSSNFRFEVRHLKKRAQPVDVEMRFVDMCRRAEHNKVLGIDSTVYAQIGHLRQLRNRVHIHAVQHDRDNDWWKFESKDVETMKEVLRAILRAQIFDPFPKYDDLFDWLEPATPAAQASS